MTEREKVINDLNIAKLMLCNREIPILTPETCVRIGQVITSAIALLKEQDVMFDKALQALVETELTLPCDDNNEFDEFCEDFCDVSYNGPQKECWLHYLKMSE